MKILQEALESALEGIPHELLTQLVAKKLAAQGIKLSKRERERLGKKIREGGADNFRLGGWNFWDRRKVHVDIALRAGGERSGAIVGLCKVGGVRPANRDAADRERAIARIFQLYALCAAGCAHALIAKREAGRIQSHHRPDTGARKAYMLWTVARIVGDV